MPAFTLEHEQDRVKEMDKLPPKLKLLSVKKSIETFILERTKMPSAFELFIKADENVITATGYEHRGKQGDLEDSYERSVEGAKEEQIAARYTLENEGYAEAKKRILQVPLYSTVMLISPPPAIPIDGYPGHSMIYFYHILPGETENTRTVKALTWVNEFTKEEQAYLLNKFLGNDEAEATESSILHTPVAAYASDKGTDSFRMLWYEIGKLYAKKPERNFPYPSFETMEKYLLSGEELWEKQHPELQRMRDNLAERKVTGETAALLGKDWNIMLNVADEKLLHADISHLLRREPITPERVSKQRGEIFNAYRRDYSYDPRVTATPCGRSAGLRDYGIASVLLGPVSGFSGNPGSIVTGTYQLIVPTGASGSGERTLKCKTCPICGASDIIAVIKNGTINCPNGCSAPYAC